MTGNGSTGNCPSNHAITPEIAVDVSGVHEQVRAGRQPVAQVNARARRAAAEMKRRDVLTRLNRDVGGSGAIMGISL